MPADRRHTLRVALSLLLLLLGGLLAISIDRGTAVDVAPQTSADLFSEARFSIAYGRNRLQLSGPTLSPEHETALQQLAAEHFPQAITENRFTAAVGLSDDWEIRSARLLYLVAATESATATIESSSIVVRGVTQDEAIYGNRLAFLRDAIDADYEIDSDVLVIPRLSQDALCERTFLALNTHAISFRQSSTSIQSSSYAFLDRLAEFAFDCPAAILAITGHTDATGHETWNLQVSRARAQAVADLLIRNGVAAERLIVAGLGSSLPVADNESIHGRAQNRRIEIELRQDARSGVAEALQVK